MDKATTIATLALFISIATLLIQYYLQIRLTKAQRSFDMMSKLNENNLAEFAYPEIWDFYNSPYTDEGKANHKFTLLIDMRLALFEEVYNQIHKFRFVDSKDWAVWRRIIERVVVQPFFAGYWISAESYFNTRFAEEIRSICKEKGIDLIVTSQQTQIVPST